MKVTGITETGQYLIFKVDHETYAMDINQVREVLEFTDITMVPRMPEFMCGVINLRGGVVPVVDLRIKFGMSGTEKTINTCIIIIDLIIEGEGTLIGLLADSVQEVMNMGADQIIPPPKIGTRLNTEFIKGMGKKNDEFVILLDMDRIFSSGDLTAPLEPEETQIQAQGLF